MSRPRPVHRHDAILEILSEGRLTTAAKLAETLNVCERTIYRDMQLLERNHPNIASAAGAGYMMRNHLGSGCDRAKTRAPCLR